MIAVRVAKIVLVAALALHASLVAFGNITDYGTNFPSCNTGRKRLRLRDC